VVGATLVYLFSVHDWWFRVGSYVALSEDPIGNLRSVALPSFTLGLFGVAIVMRTQRDAVRSVLTEPYVVAAVARGARPLMIIRRHVLRNAAIPVMTVLAVLVGAFISGTVIVESLFSVPGIGVFFLNAVRARDYAVVQAAVLISAVTFVASSMLADICYAILDPRVGSGASARSSG
jgi:peptide/nickel transport system permease protein